MTPTTITGKEFIAESDGKSSILQMTDGNTKRVRWRLNDKYELIVNNTLGDTEAAIIDDDLMVNPANFYKIINSDTTIDTLEKLLITKLS